MLILTRRINESIIIVDSNNDILAQIIVTNIDKNQVKLGINTSVGNNVWRNEMYERILQGEK
jgi:carbon storage regulator CsrA